MLTLGQKSKTNIVRTANNICGSDNFILTNQINMFVIAVKAEKGFSEFKIAKTNDEAKKKYASLFKNNPQTFIIVYSLTEEEFLANVEANLNLATYVSLCKTISPLEL